MTIKNGDSPAMAIEFNGFGLYAPEAHAGLTKREQFAAMAMQGLLSHNSNWRPASVAEAAAGYADALLAELEKLK